MLLKKAVVYDRIAITVILCGADGLPFMRRTFNLEIYMRIAVKVGTSTLAYPTCRLNIRRVEELCKVLSDLKNMGHEVILISSGAIAMGVGKLLMKKRPDDIPTKQAAAAVGQCELMYTYDELFARHNHTVGQILLTGSDVDHEDRRRNFGNTMKRLLELGVIPIINENDTVTTDEIVIGDNDTLAAIVSVNTEADILILMSDIDGLYTADPHADKNAHLISVVENVDDVMSLGKGSVSGLGTGGMTTKLSAAKMCNDAGLDMVIVNGEDPDILYRVVDGEKVGTRFIGKKK